MSSSLRRRSSAGGSGAAPVSSTPPSSASSSSRRLRATAPKRRRYLDLENRCRNPFCGAVLENKKQRYCDGSRFCQLRRGFALLCAWPRGLESGGESDDDDDEPLACSLTAAANGSRANSSPLAPSESAPIPRRSPTASATPAKDATPVATGDKRPRSAVETPAAEQPGTKKPRALQRYASADSVNAVEAPSPTTAQQVKAAAIDVVPLGVGNRAGGGGRYVRSGNRTDTSNTLSIVRPPSFSRFPSTTGTPTGAGEASFPTAVTPTQPSPPAAAVNSTVPSVAAGASSTTMAASSAPPNRMLTRTNSLPVTTTNRSRDPRVRANAEGSAGGRKTISPADYLNQIRNKDSSVVEAHPPMNEPNPPPTSTRPPEYRPLNSPEPSSSSLRNAPPPHSDFYGPSSAFEDSSRQLRRSQSDTTARPMPYESQRNDSYASHHSQYHPNDDWDRRHPRDHSNDHNGSQLYPSSSVKHYDDAYGDSGPNLRAFRDSDYGGVNELYDRGQYHDRAPLPRSSPPMSASIRSDLESIRIPSTREAETARTTRSAPPPKSEAEVVFEAMLRPKFSYSDPFLKLIVTRMASFLPGELHAVTNQTTTPRKLKFYLDYAKRVENCCGRLVKLTNNDGVARLLVADREWMVIHGTSTTTLYHQILERLLRESKRWHSLITRCKSVHSSEARHRPGGAIPGVSFLKLWSAMKSYEADEASDLDFQSNFTAGNNRFHWSFTVGNVEIGSGSAETKVDAFKNATASAYGFLNSLTILPPQDKKRVAEIDGLRDSQSSRRRSPARTTKRPSSADSSSRSSTTRTDTSPRTTNPKTTHQTTTANALLSTTHGPQLTSSTGVSRGSPPSSTATTLLARSVDDRSGAAQPVQSSVEHVQSSIRKEEVPPAAERSVSDDEEDCMSISSSESAVPSKSIPTTSSTASAVVSSQAAVTAPTTAGAPTASVSHAIATPSVACTATSPACRFCADMQSVKPGAMCLRCVRAQSSRGSGVSTMNANGASAASNRSITALQSIMRQSTGAAPSSHGATTQGAQSSNNSSSASFQRRR